MRQRRNWLQREHKIPIVQLKEDTVSEEMTRPFFN